VWPAARVALLGQLIGDGSYLRAQALRYTTASEANSRLVAAAAHDQFGAVIHRYAGRGAWHQLFLSGNGNRWQPAGVNAWLRELGIFGQRSHEKRLPDEVFRLSNPQIAILLRHLWATDGCIHVRPEGQRGSSRVYFSSSSRLLVEDVAALLSRLGIVARLRQVSHPTARTCHTVDVSGAEDQRSFLDHVGAFGPRVDPARRLAAVLEGVRSNPNVDTLPREVFDRVRALMAARGISGREMATMRGVAYGGDAHFGFAPTRALIREYADLLHDDALRNESADALFWDRVTAIEPCGTEEVFDLTVPGPASWLLDSIISHNSGAIEQDSDIVMFIHRDDSDTDPSTKGKADLIVAKHRNGPTDTIPLTFLPQLTLFRNFARP